MAVHRTTPYDDGIESYQLTEGYDAGRWINRQLVDGHWEKLAGSSSYSNRANANAGLSRYRIKLDLDTTKDVRRQVMAKDWSEVKVA